MILLRCIRPDRVIVAAKAFVASVNPNFIKPVEFSMHSLYKQSQKSTPIPIIFILSPGADPTEQLLQYSKQHFANIPSEEERGLTVIPLSKGQEKKATNKIRDAFDKGNWILLSNIHLLIEYVETIENMLVMYRKNINNQFRLFISSEPHKKFPITLL